MGTVFCVAGAATEAAPLSVRAASLFAEGLGAVAASTASATVLAARRAPTPNTRPNRSESILASVARLPRPSKSRFIASNQHRSQPKPGNLPAIRTKETSQMKNFLWMVDRHLCGRGRNHPLGPEAHPTRAGTRPSPRRGLGRPPHSRIIRVIPPYLHWHKSPLQPEPPLAYSVPEHQARQRCRNAVPAS